MSYQVLARKWRPQRFDDVVGQQATTRTLRNALASGRIAHAFVFAGSRGCGKTTTARILAKALNCEKGPSADPCGECDACVEIAQGRDMDVLEIDAASHTGIDNIREVVIAGLAISPVRDRYKVFIIDEVHQLSTPSFNALLKSIEEPPAHVVFMMATTELHKIPDTILSRSQVFEFRTIATKAIVDQLRMIAGAEKIEVGDDSLALIARAAEGSMRDAQSALDQVLAFSGQTVSLDDVTTVLGLVGRDLLFDLIEAVADEDGPHAFALADRAVESGHDLKLVCRELTRVVRDIMMVMVDPGRAGEGDLAEGERARLTALAGRFSREDLMRAFDLLAKCEQDIRVAAHPRYHFEMAMLKWMHLRRLVPLADLLEQMGSGRPALPAPVAPRAAAAPAAGGSAGGPKGPPLRTAPAAGEPKSSPLRTPAPAAAAPASSPATTPSSQLKDALLAEIRSGKAFFYNTVIAQAQSIELSGDKVMFAFLPTHRALREQLEQNRAWIEAAAERVAGRKIAVLSVQVETGAPAANGAKPAADAPEPPSSNGKRDLKAEAMASAAVQAVLDVFPGEIKDVEEL
ncbi:MAG TPA: DNA polymerase III subunit gamma/tau [Vicinamibacterales bacterium]|jgi:DNA polymerase-3 subunit gamma/tau|nr:DNA polymerase III subunit gamma/tau [Vicinamibacterales bacterium]